jgi:Rrf2 family protein
MKISSRIRYGLRAMVELAMNYERDPIVLREIAERQDISLKYLDQLMVPLKIAHLVGNTRGSGGGYSLLRSPDQITIREALTALEGPLIPSHCMSNFNVCPNLGECAMAEFWSEFQQQMNKYLDSVTLKDLADKQEELDQQSDHDRKTGKEKKSILIVDDDRMLVDTMRIVLQSRGYRTFEAYDGQECLELAREHKPDLIILDVMMGTDTEGFHVAYTLRRDPDLKDIPILMVTAINQEPGYFNFDLEKDKEYFPVNRFLEKPVAPDRLLSEIEKIFT